MSQPRPVTNDDVLLSQGLVEYYDPIEDVMRQCTVEVAKRMATVNEPVRLKLIALGVIEEEADNE
jgi:hypothetical protein